MKTKPVNESWLFETKLDKGCSQPMRVELHREKDGASIRLSQWNSTGTKVTKWVSLKLT